MAQSGKKRSSKEDSDTGKKNVKASRDVATQEGNSRSTMHKHI